MKENTTPVADSWESRIQKAAEVLGITPEDVEQGLLSKTIGIEKEPIGTEMLSDESVFRFVDFSNVFGPDGKGVAMGRVRLAYQHLLGSKNSTKTKAGEVDPRMVMLKDKFGIRGNIKMIPTEDLIRVYDPSLPVDPVTTELKERLKGAKVVLFKPESDEVAVEETIELVKDAEQGLDLPSEDWVDGALVRACAIGEKPNRIYEEDPLAPGEILRRGRSNSTRLDWSNFPQEVRQFCRICLEKSLINITSRRDLVDLVNAAKGGLPELRKLYPDADLEYRERKNLGTLPTLKLANGSASAVNNPFGVGRNRKF